MLYTFSGIFKYNYQERLNEHFKDMMKIIIIIIIIMMMMMMMMMMMIIIINNYNNVVVNKPTSDCGLVDILLNK